MAAYDDLDVKRIFIVGIASVVVTAVTALAVQVLYYSLSEWQNAETQGSSRYTRQNNVLIRQAAEISKQGVDSKTGNITIPINEAMKQQFSAENSGTERKSGSDET